MVLPTGMIDAAERAGILSDGNEHKGDVNVELMPGKVILSGMGPYGKYTEPKKVEYKGEPLEFMIAPGMLIKLMQRQDKTKCQIAEGGQLIKVELNDHGQGVYVTSLKVKKQTQARKTNAQKSKRAVG
jgi:hypothetical protein